MFLSFSAQKTMKNAQEKGKKMKNKIYRSTHLCWRPMLKTNVEDQLKQAENKQQQGAAVIIHSSLLLSYIL